MRNKKVLTLVLKGLKHVSCLISRGRDLKNLGAATANALSASVFLDHPRSYGPNALLHSRKALCLASTASLALKRYVKLCVVCISMRGREVVLFDLESLAGIQSKEQGSKAGDLRYTTCQIKALGNSISKYNTL